MRSDPLIIRFMRLGMRRKLALAEALVAVGTAAAAIRFLPFKRAVRLGSRPLKDIGPVDRDECCREGRWAVKAVAARVPWRAVCFQQGLALQWILRRRGLDARLHYGVGHDREGALAAHVWVTVNGTIIVGAEGAPDFQPVAVFP